MTWYLNGTEISPLNIPTRFMAIFNGLSHINGILMAFLCFLVVCEYSSVRLVFSRLCLLSGAGCLEGIVDHTSVYVAHVTIAALKTHFLVQWVYEKCRKIIMSCWCPAPVGFLPAGTKLASWRPSGH